MSVSGAWLMSLILIFGTLILYFALTPAFEEVYITVHNATDVDDAHTTQNFLMVVWNWWAPIVIIGALVMGFVGSQRRDPQEGYY